MNAEKLILIGGGGHCKACIDVIETAASYTIAGILDQGLPKGSVVMGYPVLGNDDQIQDYCRMGYSFLITVGHIKSATVRVRIFNLLNENAALLATVVSPTAQVSRSASVGAGSIVFHHAIINAEAKLGQNCIVNSAALVEHETEIGDHVHISTMAAINGQCKVDQGCFIGSNAVLSNNLRIPANTVIGAGAVITASIETAGTYVGNPAKMVRK